MWRGIGGVILGYIVMAAFIMITFSVVFIAIGTSGAFAEGSYEPSTVWSITSLVLGLVAGILGGFVCAAIARGGRAPKVLAGIVLVLGLLSAVAQVQEQKDKPDVPREGDVGMVEAMQNAKQPAWMAFGNPIVGVIGVLIGAGLRGNPKS